MPKWKHTLLQQLLYSLPSVPSETADPSACILSITSLRRFGRHKCFHVYVNKLHLCFSVTEQQQGYDQHLQQCVTFVSKKCHINAKVAFC